MNIKNKPIQPLIIEPIKVVQDITSATQKGLSTTVHFVDDKVLSRAFIPFSFFLWRALAYIVDIGIDGWFAFNDVFGMYLRCDECRQIIGDKDFKNRTETVWIDENSNIFSSFLSNRNKSCESFFALEAKNCEIYLGLFTSIISVIVIACICYTAACLYIIYISNSESFSDIREKIRNPDNDPKFKKHQIWFWILICIGLGPVYFVMHDLLEEWSYLKGDTFWQKLNEKVLVWIDAHIITLQLIHTMMEDIPLFIIETFMVFTHYQDFIQNSRFFYFIYGANFIYFIMDYGDWICAVTTPDKTKAEDWALYLWNTGWVILACFTFVPVIGSGLIITGKLCSYDGSLNQFNCNSTAISSAQDLAEETEIHVPIIILTTFVGGLIIRLIAAFVLAHYKTFNAWMVYVRGHDEMLEIEDDSFKTEFSKFRRTLRLRPEYLNVVNYADRPKSKTSELLDTDTDLDLFQNTKNNIDGLHQDFPEFYDDVTLKIPKTVPENDVLGRIQSKEIVKDVGKFTKDSFVYSYAYRVILYV